MKIMSYNIQHGVGMDDRLDLKRVGDVMQLAQASIIGVQEVDRFFSERSDFKDQVKELSILMDYHYCYGANIERDSLSVEHGVSQYGVAILSSFPIVSSEHTWLDSFGDEQRGVLRATIHVGNQSICIYNTHLGLDKSGRKSQVKELIKMIAKEPLPCILLGDFNTEPDSVEIKTLLEQTNLTDTFHHRNNAFTYPSDFPESKLDYVFTSPAFHVTGERVIKTEASDHLPITVKCMLQDT